MPPRREDVHCVQKDLVKPSVNMFYYLPLLALLSLSNFSMILIQVLALPKFLESRDALHRGSPEGPG